LFTAISSHCLAALPAKNACVQQSHAAKRLLVALTNATPKFPRTKISLEQKNPYKIPKSVVVQHIGVGAGTFWGCEGFLPQFSLTCSKKLHKKVKSMKNISCYFGRPWGHFCSYF